MGKFPIIPKLCYGQAYGWGRWQGYLSSVVITLGICSHYQINQDIDLGSHLDLSCCQAGCYQSSDTEYRVQTLDVDGTSRNFTMLREGTKYIGPL